MALRNQQARLADAVTSTGRRSITLRDLPSKTDFYIIITGTATVAVEVSKDNVNYITVQEVTTSSVVTLYNHAPGMAVNVTSYTSGTVTVDVEAFTSPDIVNAEITVFSDGDIKARRITIVGENEETPFRFYGPAQPGTSNGTLFTATAKTEIHNIHVANTTASAATISLAVNGSAATAANAFLFAFSIPANSTYDYEGPLVLESGDTLQGLQGTLSALTVIVSGRTVVAQ